MKSQDGVLRLLLLDASADQRDATKGLLDPSRFQVVAEGSPDVQAAAIARELMPDVILISLDDPTGQALRTLELLVVALPGSPILALGTSGDAKQMHQAMLAGARDFLASPFSADDLLGSLVELAEQQRKRTELKEVLAERDEPGQLIAVFGAKGGVGRTTLATNLAVALAEQPTSGESGTQPRVALVDLDLEFGDVALELDVVPERTIADLGPVMARLDPELLYSFLARHSSGLHILAAPQRPGTARSLTTAGLRTILSILARTHDFVLLDMPRELNENVEAALDQADLVLLLVSNQVASLKNARLTLSLMRDWGFSPEKVKLVMNEAHHHSGVPVAEAETGLATPVFWKIPHDGKRVGLGQWGRAFIHHQPRSPISDSVAGLASAIRARRIAHVSPETAKGVER